MLMGSAESDTLKAPTEKVTFLEDLPSNMQDAASRTELLPPGLTNLGMKFLCCYYLLLFNYVIIN